MPTIDLYSVHESDDVGFYDLTEFPSCGSLGISHNVSVKTALRGKGYGQAQHKLRLKKAQEIGFTYLLCTVNPENAAEKHILGKFGWQKLREFNDKCGDKLELWGRDILANEVF
jgi:RimJ/RimL family protein N-acetyltransferase